MSNQNPKSEIRNPKIVFMGTPEFAVASLNALVNTGYHIVGVVTAPDKPSGRGMQVSESAVKKYALEKDLKILQPEKLKNPEFVYELKSLNADIQVVVAFRMLPEIVWNMPPMGTINVHASLLPQYRGAAPINWAIINGENETGITTFKLQHEIDTGNILLQEKISIGENETAGELHDKLKILGAKLIVKTIQQIESGNIVEQPQFTIQHSPFTIKHAPKIFTETCKIDWNKNAEDIYNLIRGLSPYPCAFTYLNEKMLKIYFGEKELCTQHFTNGSVHTDRKKYLKFACPDGFIHCTDIQLQGKKRMNIEDFLRGYKI
jgi:methionyl-tRNA formyltransferase